MEYEYKDFPIRVFKDGDYALQDLEMYQREHDKEGWEYLGMVTLPCGDEKQGELVIRFKRPQRT